MDFDTDTDSISNPLPDPTSNTSTSGEGEGGSPIPNTSSDNDNTENEEIELTTSDETPEPKPVKSPKLKDTKINWDDTYIRFDDPAPEIVEMLEDTEQSNLYRYIRDRNRSSEIPDPYQWYKEEVNNTLSATCKFQHEYFRRSYLAIREIFNNEIIADIGKSDPFSYRKLYKELPNETQLDIAVLIDLLNTNVPYPKYLRWICRNLCHIPMDDSYGTDEKIKCMTCGTTRDMWGKHSTKYWAVLYRDNKFQLISASDHKVKKELQCDIISLSRSEKSVKISSKPSQIDIITVPFPGYDKELWLNRAVRSDNVPYLTSMPFFWKPMPLFAYDATRRAMLTCDMIVVRTMLRESIISVNDSRKLLSAFLEFYSEHDMVNAFISVVITPAFKGLKDPRKLFSEDSYATELIDIIIRKYAVDYFRVCLAPVLLRIDRGKINFRSSDVDIARVADLIKEVLKALTSFAHNIPPQLRHICSIVRTLSAVKFRTTKGTYIGVARFFFSRFFANVMRNGQMMFNDYNPQQPPSELLAPFAEVLERFTVLDPFDADFPGLIPLNVSLTPLRDDLFQLVMGACVMDAPPVYKKPGDRAELEALDQIVQHADSKRVEFIRAVYDERKVNLRSPIVGIVMNFIHTLADDSSIIAKP